MYGDKYVNIILFLSLPRSLKTVFFIIYINKTLSDSHTRWYCWDLCGDHSIIFMLFSSFLIYISMFFFFWKRGKGRGRREKEIFSKMAFSMVYENNCIHIESRNSWNNKPQNNFPPSSGFTIKITILTTAHKKLFRLCVTSLFNLHTMPW